MLATQGPSLQLLPFGLPNVTLATGSRFDVMASRNADYLTNLDIDRLTCLYTSAANMTGTFANPTCNAYPHPQYWGHYLGHWLSATAMLWSSRQDETAKSMGAQVVSILADAQQAWTALGDGYQGFLFPYSRVAFDNLFGWGPAPGNCQPVCVPWYVYHKVLAGMIDQYNLAGNQQALQVAQGMAAWAYTSVQSVLAYGGQTQWQNVLDTEWGGMNDGLYNLYAITGNPQHKAAGDLFNHWDFSAPLAAGQDDLAGLHANTHIPEIIGSAAGYELSGNMTQFDITTNFAAILNSSYTFSTGGSNDHEHWGTPNQMGNSLDSDTEESCTAYNTLKVLRHILQWTADTRLGDWYEQLLWNGLIGNQNRDGIYTPESHSTGFIYFLPLGGGGLAKPCVVCARLVESTVMCLTVFMYVWMDVFARACRWGASNDGFPCCWGTLSESFSKLGDSVFFRAGDNSALYVNLFVSATVDWSEAGSTTVQQTAGFPNSTTSTTTIRVLATQRTDSWSIRVRVPAWATGTNSVSINGQPVSGVRPGTWLDLARVWSSGDTVEVFFPPSLWFNPLNDNRTSDWGGVGSFMYGPVLLAGVDQSDRLLGFNTSSSQLPLEIVRNSSTELTFNAFDSYCNRTVPFKPLADVMLEQYTVYYHTAPASGSAISYNGSAVAPVPADLNNWQTSGGASLTYNINAWNIRSGDPGEVNSAVLLPVIQDTTHVITAINVTFQFVSGYGINPPPSVVPTRMSIVVSDLCGASGPVLATTGPLQGYDFDKCNNCFSPPQTLAVSGLNLAVTSPKRITLQFEDNDRNVQILLPTAVTITWG